MVKEIELTRDKVALVDDEDYEWLNQWKWYALNLPPCWYAARTLSIPKKKMVIMHRLITNAPDGIEVDHKDNNGLNNTRDNLRFATRGQNSHNRSMSRNNTSGFKGVFMDHGKWRARIRVNGKRISLGMYENIMDAVRAYDEAAKKYHGEFAKTNL